MTTPSPDYRGAEACSATPDDVLRDHIMNPNVPKSEAEHWAERAIRDLEADRERLREALNATAKRNRTLARDLRMRKLARQALSGGKGTEI